MDWRESGGPYTTMESQYEFLDGDAPLDTPQIPPMSVGSNGYSSRADISFGITTGYAITPEDTDYQASFHGNSLAFGPDELALLEVAHYNQGVSSNTSGMVFDPTPGSSSTSLADSSFSFSAAGPYPQASGSYRPSNSSIDTYHQTRTNSYDQGSFDAGLSEPFDPPRLRGSPLDSETLLSPQSDYSRGISNPMSLSPSPGGSPSSDVQRTDPLYSQGADKNGQWHCPFSKPGFRGEARPCKHRKPVDLKCTYDKQIDTHLKPYHCGYKGCADRSFSSRACLLRHEREKHGMHGHGDAPFTCPYPECSRSIKGIRRSYNLRDHMKRVHNDNGSTSFDREPFLQDAARKRKCPPEDSDLPAKRLATGRRRDSLQEFTSQQVRRPSHGSWLPSSVAQVVSPSDEEILCRPDPETAEVQQNSVNCRRALEQMQMALTQTQWNFESQIATLTPEHLAFCAARFQRSGRELETLANDLASHRFE